MRQPLFLDLADRRAVVVGAGPVAMRRITALLEAGAAVVVVAPDVDPRLDQTRVTVHRRRFDASDLDGAWLAVACTPDPELNAAVAAAAEARRIWWSRADDAARSAVWFPAAARHDDVTVAVSADADPGRAAELRDSIDLRLRAGDLTARRRRSRPGRVVLVGGGPGDPDLLTLRGYRALLDADVVVTDRLAPTDLLARLSADVEVVDVGKDPRGAAAAQTEINRLLVNRAREGQRVVRLKGGDPFVLGRGSEEVTACIAAGVPVDVVPGVSSATSAATLAGIPLTERGIAQQFTVASGHLPPGHSGSTVDWAALAGSDATLVLLMAVTNLAAIAEALIAAGRSMDTPCAVVENASLPSQRIVRGALSDIAARSAAQRIGPPAVVVIGEVVRSGGREGAEIQGAAPPDS